MAKSLTDKFKDMKSEPRVYREQGETAWFNDAGKFHRIGGPADEFENGDKVFYVNGLRHNEDGAAIQLADGRNFFYLEGKELTEKAYNKQIEKIKAARAKAAPST